VGVGASTCNPSIQEPKHLSKLFLWNTISFLFFCLYVAFDIQVLLKELQAYLWEK
jgi:hypothetical protein